MHMVYNHVHPKSLSTREKTGMKMKWLEPLKAKRAREGGFKDIFLTKAFYSTLGFFAVGFAFIILTTEADTSPGTLPMYMRIFYIALIALGASFIIRLIYWIAPPTICVDDTGISNQVASTFSIDRWEDISGARIEQRDGWKALAYTVNGTEQREWGISAKVSAQEVLNFVQRKA